MHLKRLEITNFRSIAELAVDLVDGANILVGPNAVGKTTVLEAIRLAKGVLVPRTQNEATQVLVHLGVISQHFPQQINFGAIASDVEKEIRISCEFGLSVGEIKQLPELAEKLAQNVVAAQQGISLPAGYFALIQFPQHLSEGQRWEALGVSFRRRTLGSRLMGAAKSLSRSIQGKDSKEKTRFRRRYLQ